MANGEVTAADPVDDRRPIEEAEAWLRNTVGTGRTERVVRRLVLHAQRLERRLQKSQARVIDLEQQLASGEDLS